MARELFVYWKVGHGSAPAAQLAAVELLRAVREIHPELQARLMRRADEAGESGESGDRATFMETYSAPAAGVTPAVQAAIEAQAHKAFATVGRPARHVEVFERLDV